MEANELKKILELHAKWLNGEKGGERANLSDADLSYVDLSGVDLRHSILKGTILRGADLRGATLSDVDLEGADLKYTILSSVDLEGADLRHANLKGADLDYSCLPLWCGSLSANFDDRQLKQIAYHLVKAGLQSENASEEAKTELRKLIPFANGFHRAEECGLIDEDDE